MTRCGEGFTVNGKTICERNFDTEKKKTLNYSILMDIGHEYCNMCCKYCCCHPKPKDANLKDYFKLDQEKMVELIRATDIKRGCPDAKHSFEIWGGEPLFNFDAFVETYDTLDGAFPGSTFWTSTNGILLGDDHICDVLVANNIRIQLSHDGLGQKLRGVDPLKDSHTLENVRSLVDMGILTTVNCTLSQVNPSWLDNIEYWKGIFGKNTDRLRIKLNHPYDSDYAFEFAFTDEEKTSKYLKEFLTLYWNCWHDKSFLPAFRGYILEQGDRFTKMKAEENKAACRAYQSWKYGVEGNFQRDWNFVIMTSGSYGECNLAPKVDNPGGVQPDYCKDCKYREYSECQHCGAMKYPKQCFYQKRWMETLETIWRTKQCLEHSASRKK